MSANAKLKILCLSFWTPPIVRPQSILIGKMIKEWQRQGINPVIVTYNMCGDWQINLSIYKIPQFGVESMLARIPGLVTVLEIFYYQKLFRAVKKIIKKHDINLVFSFSNPQSSNILGAILAKKLKVKFVAYFSDPWFDNPYKKFSFWGAKKVRFLEKFITENSDRVVFVTEQAKQLVMKKYPKDLQERARVIPHCFDLQDYPQIQKPAGEKFIISYIGAFYKKRNPELLFKALQKIINRQPDFIHKFRVELIGAANDYADYSAENIEEMADLYGLKNNVEIIPPVSYEESLKYMKLSDCLVVIDADIADSPFLPSKVIDYAGSGNVIIGITPANSPTAQFIKSLGYESFNYNQINKLTEYLKGLISGEIKIEINKEYLEQYDVRNTTTKLIKLFNEASDN